MKPGDRVRVTRGYFEGVHGVIVPSEEGQHPETLMVKLAEYGMREIRVAWLEPEIARAKKVPLLEYLDKLEATAKAAPCGTWRGYSDQILSDGRPATNGYDGYLVAESMIPTARHHVEATQPKATLALIAKLREALAWSGAANSGCSGDLMLIEVPE